MNKFLKTASIAVLIYRFRCEKGTGLEFTMKEEGEAQFDEISSEKGNFDNHDNVIATVKLNYPIFL